MTLQGRSGNGYFYGLLSILLSSKYLLKYFQLSVIRRNWVRFWKKNLECTNFFSKMTFFAYDTTNKNACVFCWFGLNHENRIFLSNTLTIFLVLNHQKASIYAKSTTKLPRLPVGIIWSVDVKFCARLGNICSYEKKLVIKCRCFLLLLNHALPNISWSILIIRDPSQLSGICTK